MQPQPPLGPITRVPSRHAVQPVQPPLSGGLHVTPPMRPQRRMSFKNLPAGPLPTGEIGHTVVSSPFTAAAEALGSHVARGAGMNEELVGTVVRTMAGQITGDMSERTRQVQVWIPHFLVVIRAYFDVTHQYVLLKALALLFPFMEFLQYRRRGKNARGSQVCAVEDETSRKDYSAVWALRSVDLYIPLMTFVTYVLLCGVQKGALSDFHPEILPSTVSYGLALLVAEVVLYFVGAFFLQETNYKWPSSMDVLSLSSYKYFHVCLIMVLSLVTGDSTVYRVASIYLACVASLGCCLAGSWLRNSKPPSRWSKFRLPLLSVIHGLAQAPLCWLLSPSVTS